MYYIDWNDSEMSIGIKLIDDQHKKLLKIINQLATSINEHSQRRDVLLIVDDLINYSDYHFTTEEKLFDKFDYDENEIHKKEHTGFVNKFISIRNRISKDQIYFKRSSIEIASDIFTYIVNWFIDHVLGSDRKYVELFKEKGLH